MRNPYKPMAFVFGALLVASLGASGATTEKQPQMHDALASLEAAEKSLQNAPQDKGGHRRRALELTRAAIDEVERGIAFDRKH